MMPDDLSAVPLGAADGSTKRKSLPEKHTNAYFILGLERKDQRIIQKYSLSAVLLHLLIKLPDILSRGRASL